MICLTGDIHHSSLKTGNQKACGITEIQCAQRFLHMLEDAGVKATFFITGKAFEEEWDDLKQICSHPLISVQGHNFQCFKPELFHRVWKKLTGNYNGPAALERRDIKRTIDAVQRRTGKRISCWRNHMYMRGPNTDSLLHQCGIKICSDGVKALAMGPTKHSSGIWHFPINVIPDHEHLYHAERTPEWVDWWIKRYNWSDDFGPQSYSIETWTDLVLQQLDANEKRGAISNLIIHPITMYLCDGFKQFERRILPRLAKARSIHMDQIALEQSHA